jgi:HPt (histidine-containing phosphotransfer) domain-containing protein
MGGDRSFYAKVAASFRVESQELLSSYQQAFAQGRYADAVRHLHTLAGLAGMVGASQLKQSLVAAEADLQALTTRRPEPLAAGAIPGAHRYAQQLEEQLHHAIRMMDAVD